MSREDPQLKLRLTEEMKARVTEAARTNGRSVNAEIVARLSESFEMDAAVKSPEASYEAIKPLMDVLKTEFAAAYEDRISAMQAKIDSIARQIGEQDK